MSQVRLSSRCIRLLGFRHIRAILVPMAVYFCNRGVMDAVVDVSRLPGGLDGDK